MAMGHDSGVMTGGEGAAGGHLVVEKHADGLLEGHGVRRLLDDGSRHPVAIPVDAPKKLDHQLIVIDGLVDVAEGVRDRLEPGAEDRDGGVVLLHGVELRLEMELSGALVVEEERFQLGPKLKGRGFPVLNKPEKFSTYGVLEPGFYRFVDDAPRRVVLMIEEVGRDLGVHVY